MPQLGAAFIDGSQNPAFSHAVADEAPCWRALSTLEDLAAELCETQPSPLSGHSGQLR